MNRYVESSTIEEGVWPSYTEWQNMNSREFAEAAENYLYPEEEYAAKPYSTIIEYTDDGVVLIDDIEYNSYMHTLTFSYDAWTLIEKECLDNCRSLQNRNACPPYRYRDKFESRLQSILEANGWM